MYIRLFTPFTSCNYHILQVHQTDTQGDQAPKLGTIFQIQHLPKPFHQHTMVSSQTMRHIWSSSCIRPDLPVLPEHCTHPSVGISGWQGFCGSGGASGHACPAGPHSGPHSSHYQQRHHVWHNRTMHGGVCWDSWSTAIAHIMSGLPLQRANTPRHNLAAQMFGVFL